MANLNVYDRDMLLYVSMWLDDPKTLQAEEPRTLCSILYSLSLLRHKDVKLIERTVDVLVSQLNSSRDASEQLPVEDLSSMIVACASLNFMPAKLEDGNFLSDCVEQIKDSPRTLLNTVHALAMLQKADSSAISSVLNEPGNILLFNLQ